MYRDAVVGGLGQPWRRGHGLVRAKDARQDLDVMSLPQQTACKLERQHLGPGRMLGEELVNDQEDSHALTAPTRQLSADTLPYSVRFIGAAESKECDYPLGHGPCELPCVAIESSRDHVFEEGLSEPLHPPGDERGMLPVKVWIGLDDVPARPEDRLVDLEEIPGFRPGMASHPG